MKNKIIIAMIIVTLLNIFPHNVSASSEISGSFPIPTKESNQAVMEYIFDYPADAERILGEGYSVSKGEITYFGPNSTTRKLTVRVKGQEVIKKPATATGYFGAVNNRFTATPGNAMCRFSDGRDWQITSYQPDGELRQYKLPGTGSVPTNPNFNSMPQLLAFVTPSINTSNAVWYSGGKQINSSLIDMNTVKVPQESIKATISGSSVIFKTGTNYDPENPSFGIRYNPPSRSLGQLVPITPTNEAFLTGHAACYRYPAPMEYTLEAETKGEKVYLYEGTINYKYVKPTDPYLTGTLTTDPNNIKFDDKDIKVKVTLDAEVHNLTNANVIDKYLIYLRTEDGSISAPAIEVKANGKKTVKGTHEFTIPKSALNSKDEFTQVYVGRARACYKPSELYKGCIETDLLKANTLVFKEAPKTPPPPENTPPTKKKPTAVLGGNNEVKLGDYTTFDGFGSSDPDGYIESFRWVLPGAKDLDVVQDVYDPMYVTATGWYDQLGPQKAILYVKDNDGLQDGTYYSFEVVEPTVEARMAQTGTLKENRKVTFTNNSDSPTKYPVIASKIKWTIQSEYGDLDNQIKYQGTLNGKQSIDVLFKKAGDYRVTLEVENTAGYTSSATRVITIQPDEAPYVNFDFQQKIYRDPADGNKATFHLYDRSYSFDGDQIVRRNWYVIFDANNDGLFNETRTLINSGNNIEISYSTTRVGKYKFMLEVHEEFGQPTIDALVTSADRRTNNTWQ